jgi:hypothetical protein
MRNRLGRYWRLGSRFRSGRMGFVRRKEGDRTRGGVWSGRLGCRMSNGLDGSSIGSVMLLCVRRAMSRGWTAMCSGRMTIGSRRTTMSSRMMCRMRSGVVSVQAGTSLRSQKKEAAGQLWRWTSVKTEKGN